MPDPITAYLASRGAAPSAANANRVREFYAPNPDLLDRRAAGLPGGLDDNSAVLDAMLDKHIAESMPQIPQGSVEVGQPEKIPPPSRTAPAIRGPGEVGGTKAGASRQANYGPGESPNRQMNYGAPTADAGKSTSQPTLDGTVLANSGSQVGDTQRSGLTEWLLGLLAGGAGLYGMSKMGGKGAPMAAPADALPGTVPPATATAATPDATDPATMRARMEAEIAAENDAMTRKMEEDARRQRSQRNTEDLGRAARRATGRK